MFFRIFFEGCIIIEEIEKQQKAEYDTVFTFLITYAFFFTTVRFT